MWPIHDAEHLLIGLAAVSLEPVNQGSAASLFRVRACAAALGGWPVAYAL